MRNPRGTSMPEHHQLSSYANCIAVGTEADHQLLTQRLEGRPDLGYRLLELVRVEHSTQGNAPATVDITEIRRLITRRAVDQIIFSSSYQLNGSFEALEEFCHANHVSMRILSKESDDLFLRARIRDRSGIPIYLPRAVWPKTANERVKRCLDVVGALLGLALLAPLFLILALAIKLESPGPIFFRQRRSLAGEEPSFDLIKFRSMHDGAQEERKTLESKNARGPLFKLRDDPRVTRLGRLMRRFSLDEIPQLINVLRGDMSLVGPRPLPLEDYGLVSEDEHLEGFLSRRARARAGMTGLWQVSGRSELNFRDMVLLDMYYIQKQSLLLDFKILARTLPAVLLGRGAC